ncbi:HAD-IB family hydrolase [Nocardioides albus]|uniref:HAD superfamily hydrolase (TIGR01490 family) n=1 Tax=Nocardioides albus TaxID=1841 RepID=A0A7W5A5B5_9ACTN|nr:HAD-IB family hydrolase [Nocardioides albus]MBB3089957.1 HAD superfamily hydrolase (TIGR01490 family) [Nocardioides albus]
MTSDLEQGTNQDDTRASIRERLAGQHVLLTGVTGFVGEALLHLLLTEVPDVRLSVLVRPKGSISGAERIAKMLAKPIFETVADAEVNVVEGDLSDPPALPGDLDAVVHSAGDVSFDPPVDEGFITNVVGVRELLRRIEETGRDVHYLHVSTAYVSGRRRGHIPEGPVDHSVDVEAELAWGLAQRAAVEERSRSVEVISKLRKQAEREHGRAGMMTAAAAAEEARKQWVKKELVRLGTERARSLGWTDCYTFTKALGERVVEGYAATGRRATIYRPAIIESSLARPYPGWIEGFKMAEPLILAYGRGELPLFPAAADTTADIVPVDHVVASIVACLAHPPEPGKPAYFHLASGDRNPLTFGMLYESVRAYFEKEPFAAGDRGAARLPEWTFQGGASVERLMATGEKVHKIADTLLGLAPRSDRTRGWARDLDRQGRRLQFLRRYLDLYKEYAQADLRFVDTNTLSLYRSLSPADQETFAFDTAVIDWHAYLHDIHVPSVTKPVRDLDELRKLRKRPVAGALPQVSASSTTEGTGSAADGGRVAAFFDLDGTLMSSNVIETYLWLRLGELSGTAKAAEIARVAGKVPKYVWADRAERSTLLRTVYREYAGARLSDLDELVDEHLTTHILGRLAPDAVRRIREHRAAGHVTVLVTGAIRPLTRPLMPLFDHIEAADLAIDDRGVCTGHLSASPLVGESRGAFVREWTRREGISPADCFAYADSHSDLPLLAAVGRPVAVRPDVPLFRHAKRSHWTIVDWESPAHATRTLDPAGRH